MIYFDNAATTSPKPDIVINAVKDALIKYCANPGRAGHKVAYDAAEMIYDTRKKLASFFGCSKPENIIFTHNCTQAINFAIKGLAVSNGHFICSSLEHNAVTRPLETLKISGVCDYSVAEVCETDEETVENFKRLIKGNTIAIVVTGASNVFGKKLPIEKLATLAHKYNIKIIVDAAQTAGVCDINCEKQNIDFLCVAAHKGLYAPMGAGILICNCEEKLKTIIEGGTGNLSSVLTQPENYPERLESGTLSVADIAGISAGIDFVNKNSIQAISLKEDKIIKYLFSKMIEMKNIALYTNLYSAYESFTPVMSFNVKGLSSEETGALLSDMGIAVRAGFHCAPFAHRHYKTEDIGTVRISPSFFTRDNDVNLLLNSIFKIAKAQ